MQAPMGERWVSWVRESAPVEGFLVVPALALPNDLLEVLLVVPVAHGLVRARSPQQRGHGLRRERTPQDEIACDAWRWR